jgi:tetratricopeptide (TPR) repeat protein/tRNA A-37 threonylcarbamoyl transferase component Bud32
VIEQLGGRYAIEREVGRGGMATVYLARDLKHERPVAIKVLRPELAAMLGAERFLREIRITAVLQHPHILALIDSGAERDVVYYVMPYIEGENLRGRLLRERQLPLGDALRITRAVASALEFAHRHGIVHRDIKPENILLHQGEPLVADFGIARAVGGEITSDRLTEAGIALGTPAYMSPEQCTGDALLDGRSDEYSLACVLYEMLAGDPPYIGPTAQAILAKQLTQSPPRLGAARAVPPAVDTAVSRALAKSPPDRFATVGQFAAALGEPTSAARRWPTRAAVTAGVGLAVITLAVVEWRTRTRAPPARVTATVVTPRRAIAVLGFQNLSGRSAEAWLSTALSEMLTTELAAGDQLRTIPGEDVAQMKISLALPDADGYGKETLGRIRQSLGADAVVLGSYVPLGGGQVRLDVRLQDALAGETLTAISEKGSEGHIDDLVGRAGTALRRRLGIGELDPAGSAAVRAALPTSPDAARWYAEGLAKLRVFDGPAAQGLLARAVAREPGYAPAHAALAATWAALGYDRSARDEAKRAVELSAALPTEQRLWAEGRYAEATRAWPSAIESYRTLWTFFPDNADYGLRLAAAQTMGGKGGDALVTVAALRQLPGPAGTDPRIDIAEAQAAYALGDMRRAKVAADSAIAKGEALDARLLLAGARTIAGNALTDLGAPQQARASYEEARRLYIAAGDRAGAGRILNNMGIALFNQGDFAGARRSYEQALSVFRGVGNQFAIGAVLNNLGNATERQGDLAPAARLLQEALSVRREIGDRHGVAESSLNIGTLLHRQGALAAARRHFEEADSIGRELGDRSQVAIARHDLAGVLADQGDLAGAKRTYEEVLTMRRERGDQSGVAYTLDDLADVLSEQGDLGVARARLEEAVRVRSALGESGNLARSEMGLASLMIDEGRPRDAEVPARRAVLEFQRERAASAEAEAWAVVARSLLEQGLADSAAAAIAPASTLVARSGDRSVRWTVGTVSARVLATRGRIADATRLLDAIRAEAGASGFIGYRLEASLALGEASLHGRDTAAARTSLAAVDREATARGFGLIARKARGLLPR